MRERRKRGADDAAPAHARRSGERPAHEREPEDASDLARELEVLRTINEDPGESPARTGHEAELGEIPTRARHGAEPEEAPVHVRRVPAEPGPEPDEGPGPSGRSGWLVPVVAAAVAVVCLAIAIPVALLSGNPEPTAEPEPAASEEVILDEPAAEPGEGEVALAESALATGADLVAKADALADAATSLDQAVKDIEAGGYEVGYYVATPDGQEVMALNPDRLFYGASSIKGPFVLRAFPEGVSEGYRGLVENAIQWSDNDSYYQLRGLLGYDILSDQLDELGVTGFTPYMSYAWMTPRQLASLWEMDLAPLSLEGESGDWLRQTFTATANSALGALPASGPVPVVSAYSKAGWIASGELSCTVDAGEITLGDPSGGEGAGPTYIVVAMTSKGEDFEALAKVENALVAYLYTSDAMA